MSKVGQPAIIEHFSEEQLQQIKMLYGWGHTVSQIADFLGMGRSTFYDYLNRFPELKTAMRQGKAIANSRIDRSLFAQAVNGNVQAIRWWDMSRRGIGNYPQQQEDELENKEDFNPEMLDDEELVLLNRLMSKAHGAVIEGESVEVSVMDGYEDIEILPPEEQEETG